MSLLSFLSYLFFLVSAYLAAKVYLAGKINQVNRLFCNLAVAMCIALLGLTFFYSAPDIRSADIWHRVSNLGYILFTLFLLRFIIKVTGAKEFDSPLLLAALYLPAAFFFGAELMAGTIDGRYARNEFGWISLPVMNRTIPVLFGVYNTAYILAGMVITFRWFRNTKSYLQRSQALNILVLSVIYLVGSILVFVVFIKFKLVNLTQFSFILQGMWVIGLLDVILRYHLVNLAPSIAAGTVIKSMADSVIVVDHKGRIVETNTAAQNLFGADEDVLAGRFIGELIFRGRNENLEKNLDNAGTVTYNCNYESFSGRLVPVSGIIIPVKDLTGAVAGRVIIGRDNSRFAEVHNKKTAETEKLQFTLDGIKKQNELLERFMSITKGRDIEYNRLKAEANELYKRLNKSKRYTVN